MRWERVEVREDALLQALGHDLAEGRRRGERVMRGVLHVQHLGEDDGDVGPVEARQIAAGRQSEVGDARVRCEEGLEDLRGTEALGVDVVSPARNVGRIQREAARRAAAVAVQTNGEVGARQIAGGGSRAVADVDVRCRAGHHDRDAVSLEEVPQTQADVEIDAVLWAGDGPAGAA